MTRPVSSPPSLPRSFAIVLGLLVGLLVASPVAVLAQDEASAGEEIPNRLIDYDGYAKTVQIMDPVRQAKRLTETQFLDMMSESDVILLDARSVEKFHMRHVKGAINLPLPDFTADDLAQVIPSQDSKILIYCNNNFLGAKGSLPPKAPSVSLNLMTYTSLMAYGYENVYELGPLLHVSSTKLPFAGTEVDAPKQAQKDQPVLLMDVLEGRAEAPKRVLKSTPTPEDPWASSWVDISEEDAESERR